MRSVMSIDPFELWPKQVETVKLVSLPTAPGLSERVIADGVRVIIKRQTSSDSPQEYESRESTRRLHIKPADLPSDLARNPDSLLNLVVETQEGTRLKITDADRGDDMDMGELRFVVALAKPWGSDSL